MSALVKSRPWPAIVALYQDLVDRGRIAIVAAVYDLETGVVAFLDTAD